MKLEKNSFFFVLLIGVLFGFFSPFVSSQLDSCNSALPVSNLIPFNTTSLTCTNAWSSQSFVLRFGQTDSNTWSFVLSAPDRGTYIAIGFSNNGNMVKNSALAGWISSNGGPGIVKQYYLGGYSSGSCPPDQGSLPLVANTSVIISQSSQLYLAFQLNTQMPQWSHLIYAVGPSGSLPSSNYLPEHSSKASGTVDYSGGTVSGASGGSSFNKARWHGLLVTLGWGILMPIGIMMARYFKKYDPFWFYAHISIQGIGFVLGLVGIIIGFSLDDDDVNNIDVHKAIGIIILVFGALQVKAFFIRPVKTSKIRRYWNWYHHNIGRAAVILGIANIFLGLNIADESTGWSVGYGIFLAIWGLSCIFLEVKLWMSNRDD
ncbi:hypothetical protein LUZ61_011912 [Rhynchospora tenuis]|uniref:Cytochrome b561 and DOMON domain-containing protein n=1 Tax=Rhynchospora tenuis TaxID=198213 RepID=A0AAD6F0M6_9POAL|nr:hypothetical protein LUZ61_011912 [Rhynchospora tenuis]